MRNTGNPLSVELSKTFTEVAPPARLAYLSLIDFVPDHERYEHLTTIDIEPAGDRTNVVMTDPRTCGQGGRPPASTPPRTAQLPARLRPLPPDGR